ncbi:hypothetical protein SAMN04488577_3972 [Bacillus sp. cl95]|nr:hypothetical protein SAMN02799634_108157 [Bacillus sp. UNCCL13]SFQ90958.1 hypothetical protein SAMN04488577_3972 [Bacillus sp. cl95]
MLIGTEDARLLENAIAFPSCVGLIKEVLQCPAGAAGQVRPHRRPSAEEAQRPPETNLTMKKPALGLFHNSSAESEHSGVEINQHSIA